MINAAIGSATAAAPLRIAPLVQLVWRSLWCGAKVPLPRSTKLRPKP